MKNSPKVSCVMAVYNGEQFLPETMESILAQTFSDFEFLVIDDCSTDGTVDILKKYKQRDNRVRIVRNAENIGLTKSLNRGIRSSRGEYLARTDADDVSRKDRFQLQASFLEAHEEYALVGSWYVKMNERGKELWRRKVPLKDKELRALLIQYNPLPHSSWMMRRRAVEQIGLYDESWEVSQDYELLLRISTRHKIGAIPAFLLYSRISHVSETSTRNRELILAGLRARKHAIQRGQYPKTAYVFFLPALLSLLVPISVRQLLKRFVAYG